MINKKTTLKTLKDIPCVATAICAGRNVPPTKAVGKEDLRKCAIEWVKHIRKQPKNTGEEIFRARIVENWIMHFFGISSSEVEKNEKGEERK